MWDTPFKFEKLNHTPPKPIGEWSLITHNYSFRGNGNKRYLAIAEQYDYSIYVVKFCHYERKNHPDRFTKLTGFNECNRVLTTMGFIMKELYSKNPYASFGFIGTNLPEEAKSNTKRFRLYSTVVTQLVAPVDFIHVQAHKHSAYLLLNKNNEDPGLRENIEKMFNSIYNLDE